MEMKKRGQFYVVTKVKYSYFTLFPSLSLILVQIKFQVMLTLPMKSIEH